MYSEKYGVTVKAIISEDISLLADDGTNPVRIPLTLEDAEKLTAELNNLIETEKRKRENNV